VQKWQASRGSCRKPRGDSIESSDLDVLIELDPDARFGFSYFSLPRYFEEILGVRTDVVSRNAIKPYVYRQCVVR